MKKNPQKTLPMVTPSLRFVSVLFFETNPPFLYEEGLGRGRIESKGSEFMMDVTLTDVSGS